MNENVSIFELLNVNEALRKETQKDERNLKKMEDLYFQTKFSLNKNSIRS